MTLTTINLVDILMIIICIVTMEERWSHGLGNKIWGTLLLVPISVMSFDVPCTIPYFFYPMIIVAAWGRRKVTQHMRDSYFLGFSALMDIDVRTRKTEYTGYTGEMFSTIEKIDDSNLESPKAIRLTVSRIESLGNSIRSIPARHTNEMILACRKNLYTLAAVLDGIPKRLQKRLIRTFIKDLKKANVI